MPGRSLTYVDAGVDIDAADSATDRIRRLSQRTFDQNVLAGVGAFGAAYSLQGRQLRDPVLVSSADGVGTKLKIAFATGRHDTVGQCLVNHCINDIAVQGATPLFFLDYLSVGRLDPDVAEEVVSGISLACLQNGVALIGGETAEMPGLYNAGEYDLAGFIVGVAERGELLLGSRVAEGSELVGLPSSGLHTNGYSLARKILFEHAGYAVDQFADGLGVAVGDELLKVHRSYLKPLRALAAAGLLEAAAHITGGGITENTPRMLPDGLRARVRLGSWPALAVFGALQRLGGIPDDEMLRVFNMGLGLIASVPHGRGTEAVELLQRSGEAAFLIGSVEAGGQGVAYES
ncbi:MAG: phosphoribosylformylglycinamidine cyclo-ligase [Bryobacterales bacterium]|nr:phosphoribosylformylglycinamidine cyclo-ligase [Bryobacterales bacterium]